MAGLFFFQKVDAANFLAHTSRMAKKADSKPTAESPSIQSNSGLPQGLRVI
jgi:hypothetical protein